MRRDGWLLKKGLLWVSFIGVVAIATSMLVAFKTPNQDTDPFFTPIEPIEPITELTPLEIATNEVVNGLNRFFPILNGTIFENIPGDQASRSASETDSDNDGFPNWQVYDYGSPDDDGYGGIVKIYDEGNTLKYVLENFQTPSEIWTGWFSSPDTDQFPAGGYSWNLSVQIAQRVEQWQGNVNVVQQSDEQFAATGTLQLSNSQGQFRLVISNTNPLVVDALQPALLVGGRSTLTFTDTNGVTRQGTWTVTNVGVSRLWLDENANGLIDSGETVDINYDNQTGTWKAVTSSVASPGEY